MLPAGDQNLPMFPPPYMVELGYNVMEGTEYFVSL
jgi:hypothetical protein